MPSYLTRRLAPSRTVLLRRKVDWLRQRRVARLARLLTRFFHDQAARVEERWLRSKGIYTKAEGDAIFEQEAEDHTLLRLIVGELDGSATLSSELATGFIGELTQPPSEAERITMRILTESVSRVRGINVTTRQAIRRVIALGVSRGYTAWEIANGVPDAGFRGLRDVVEETYRGRALAIAQTEVASVMSAAAIDRYARYGMTLVEVADGPDCGWRNHDDPDLANGSIRAIADARDHLLAHPHCRRVFLPFNPAWDVPSHRVVPVPEIHRL